MEQETNYCCIYSKCQNKYFVTVVMNTRIQAATCALTRPDTAESIYQIQQRCVKLSPLSFCRLKSGGAKYCDFAVIITQFRFSLRRLFTMISSVITIFHFAVKKYVSLNIYSLPCRMNSLISIDTPFFIASFYNKAGVLCKCQMFTSSIC